MKRITRTLAGALISTTALIGAVATEAGAAPTSTVSASQVVVRATAPTALTVAGHRGQPVTVWTRGTAPITMRPLNARPITFKGLMTGRTYAIYVGREKATTARTLAPLSPITNAIATPGTKPRTLDIRWRHDGVDRTTSASIRYLVSAVDADGTRVRTIVQGGNRAQLAGIDASKGVKVSITPYVDGARGKGVVIAASKAPVTQGPASLTQPAPVTDPAPSSTPAPTTTETTVQVVQAAPVEQSAPVAAVAGGPAPAAAPAPAAPRIVPAAVPVVPAPAPAPTPAPAPVPAPAPTPTPAPVVPATRLACPDGWTDAGSECTQSSPYTYSTKPYTYETIFVQHIMELCTVTVDGQVVERQNCVRYVPQQRLVDQPGWTNTGTEWRRQDPAPSGWTDTGSGYQRTTAKITVPA